MDFVPLPMPPLGLCPPEFHQGTPQQRINDILQAMQRYMMFGRPVPKNWLAELIVLLPLTDM